MPSHTGEDSAKAARICKLIFDKEDVAGNDGADLFAKEGVTVAQSDPSELPPAQDRMVLTRMAQDIMVEVWMAHRNATPKAEHDDLELDEAELAFLERSADQPQDHKEHP